MTIVNDINDPRCWLLMPPGHEAILRFAADSIPDGARLATASELLAANLGRPFPWGQMPTPKKAGHLWHNYRMGYGGLFHDKWFITNEGRLGGAQNVPTELPGSLRSCFHYDGGTSCDQTPADNEGFAIVKKVSEENHDVYRRVQMHAAEHVAADGGSIIMTPISPEGKVFIGFVGRCQTCPNPELISFRQLQKAVPEYNFELLPEWKNWSLTPPRKLVFR